MTNRFPFFDQPIPDNGYIWWYVDAISDDGQHALTIIAMLGNVFSPYYAWARKKTPTDPMDHCALNVVLYGKSGKRWAMTERPRASVTCEPYKLSIGPSHVEWHNDHLRIVINETTVPLPSKLQGEVRIYPSTLCQHTEQLDANGRHWWTPVAPYSRAEVRLQQPELSWDGHAYFDNNKGSAPLEQDFEYWDWSRATLSGQTAILYDVTRRNRERETLALSIDANGKVERFTPADYTPLPTTGWRVNRSTHSDDKQAKVLQTLEDTPFYSRSLLSTRIAGEETLAMHESLSLDRFQSLWVQCLLPFRMPRRHWKG